jgi:hypothetical protein
VSLAQRFERRLEGLVGGAFARVFKGQVEPVEIGSALQREAGDKRNVMGSGRVLAPNRFRVTLSSSDYERLTPWEAQLTMSLAELVQEHLDENRWETIGDIEVYLALDDQLHTGVFGVASRMDSAAPPRTRPHDSMSLPIIPGAPVDVYPEPHERPAPPQYAPAQFAPPAPMYSPPPSQYVAPPPPVSPPVRQQHSALIVDGTGRRFELRRGGNIIGRGSESDLQLLDQGVSRKHINVEYDGAYATVHDLGSTNGTTINGHPVGSQVLRHGDVVRIGHTKLVFQQDLA